MISIISAEIPSIRNKKLINTTFDFSAYLSTFILIFTVPSVKILRFHCFQPEN